MRVSMDWEDIDLYSSRAKVPGGWLVRTLYYTESTSGGYAIAMAFVPDPEWKWGNHETDR